MHLFTKHMVEKITGGLLFILLILSSCSSHKQLVYLQDVDEQTTENIFFKQPIEYRIQNQDILYIKILSLSDEANEMLNVTSTRYQQNLFQNETSLFINGYSVSDSGYVDVPVVGEILVLDMTLDEAKAAIKSKIDEYLIGATVIVKLISFKFTVIGEVARPGMYNNYNNQVSVLEAIGRAGDITDFGNRERILVVRPTKKETRTFRIDLTKKELLSSDGFFLLPNDIVYVEPLSNKTFRLNTPTISLFLTTVTTLILVLSFVLK